VFSQFPGETRRSRTNVRLLKKGSWLVALLLVLAMVAAACGDDDDNSGNAGNTTETTAASEEVPQGGTLVIGAEQEGDCLDWIGSCSGASWMFWSVNTQTMPRTYSVEKDGDGWKLEPTNLLTGEADLKTSPKQVVTYHINPKAVWSDGTPITSKDFKFTWEQVMNTSDVYDKSGYDKIESVDDSDPATAVVTFKEPYADWKSTPFAGNYGIYPAHLVKDHSELANGYTFSGGPWKLDHWTKGTEWVLVPNDKYWGPKPKLDKVVFKLISDTSAEFQAFKAGEVQGIYPQPQLDAIDQINAGLEGAKAQYSGNTGNAEGLWINNSKPPFDDVKVRQALAYSLDRDAIVKRLFGGVKVDKALQTVTAPILSDYATLDAFSKYKKDLSKVDELMKSAGYAKGTDGIWAKGGQKASFVMKTTAGNKRRELTEQVMQQQLKDAGFEMTIQNAASGDLFGDQLPKGDFNIGLYANVLTSFYPSNCNLFCIKNIPTDANKFSGNNWTRTNDSELDKLYTTVDTELDIDKAQAANKDGDKRLAEIVGMLPLDPLPNILLTSTKIVGPVADNPVMGPFWGLSQWGLKA
jgi:peptide/nickel transport system substrate-binding protein